MNKVLTNREVIEMMEKRYAEDEQLRAYKQDYLSKDQQVALNACWRNELESYKGAMESVCQDERFGSSVQDFLAASDQVHECCPYELAYVVNESDGLYNEGTGERISENNGSRMNESPEIIDGESKNETHEQEMFPSREPSLSSQYYLNDESAPQMLQHDQRGEENEKTPEESSLVETHAPEFDFGVQVPSQEEKQDETIGETLSVDR